MLLGKKIVGLCVTRVCSSEGHDMITALNELLKPHDYRLFVYTSISDLLNDTPSDRGEKTVYNLVDFSVLDALVIMYETIKDRELTDSLISRAKAKSIPVFIINGRVEGCVNLNFDYSGGFEEIVSHALLHHKLKNPHFIAGMRNNSFSDERIDAFKKVLAENGMTFSDDMVSYGEFWSIPTKTAVEKLIKENRLPDGFICANDSMAIAVCTTLKENGYRVPQDVIVTGFDGIDDAKIVSPTISTAVCSGDVMAGDIAELIFSGDIPENGMDIVIKPMLQLAQSCGCVMESKTSRSEYLTILNNRFNRYQGDEGHMFTISAKIFDCGSINEINSLLDRSFFYDMHCILYKEFADSSANPREITTPSYRDGIVLFDSDDNDFTKPYEFNCRDAIPSLEKELNMGYPLIFTAMNYMDVPMGYACFHFHNYDIENYYRLIQTMNILNNAVGGFQSMRYQQYLSDRMEELYKLDRMTGLYNRNALVTEFELLVSKLRGTERSVTFVLSDLDRLKYINDTFGHNEGDFAIKSVAKALKACSPKNAITARWGGDEMVAVFEGECDEAALKEAMKQTLEEIRAEGDKPYEITSSIGVVTTRVSADDTLDSITKLADERMYNDKVAKRKQRV